VLPPSVERKTETLLQLIPFAVVPDTFHVTVCDELPAQFTAVFGDVTANAAPVLTTDTLMFAELTPPKPARLSRAVRSSSASAWSSGAARPPPVCWRADSTGGGWSGSGLVMGFHDRMIGPVPVSPCASVVAAPRSRSSQQYVSGSPLGSLPEAVKVNGVFAGIV
jgi:hypothetical protein